MPSTYYNHIWWFPEIEVPRNHPNFRWDFPLETIQLLEYPHDYGNPHITTCFLLPGMVYGGFTSAKLLSGREQVPVFKDLTEHLARRYMKICLVLWNINVYFYLFLPKYWVPMIIPTDEVIFFRSALKPPVINDHEQMQNQTESGM